MLYIFLYLYNQRVLNRPMTWLRLLAATESYFCNSQWIVRNTHVVWDNLRNNNYP